MRLSGEGRDSTSLVGFKGGPESGYDKAALLRCKSLLPWRAGARGRAFPLADRPEEGGRGITAGNDRGKVAVPILWTALAHAYHPKPQKFTAPKLFLRQGVKNGAKRSITDVPAARGYLYTANHDEE
jgi:hypothetical protein